MTLGKARYIILNNLGMIKSSIRLNNNRIPEIPSHKVKPESALFLRDDDQK